MNGSRAATLTLAWRLASFRRENLPWFPIVVLTTLAFLAIFADVIAPHDPQVGLLSGFRWDLFWPIVLIAIGLLILVRRR